MSAWKIVKVVLVVIAAGVLLAAAAAGYVYWAYLHMRSQDLLHQANWISGPKLWTSDDTDPDNLRHFSGPVRPIRSVLRTPADDMVFLTVIVRPDGQVADAWMTSGNPLFGDEAADIAKQWKFVPYKHNGKPVWVKFAHANINVYPPERRPAASAPFPDLRDWKDVKITLERSACYGTCPAYRLEIRGDGSVTYDGHAFVALEGVHHGKIAADAVQRLVEKFRAANFFKLYPQYDHKGLVDAPSYAISLTVGGKSLRVGDYDGESVGMPSVVKDLEDEVDRVAGTMRWTRSNAETVPSLIAEGWDFNRQDCANRSMIAGVAQFGSLETLNQLLAQGAPIGKLCWTPFRDIPGYGSALANAAERGDASMIDVLLRAGAAGDLDALRYAIFAAADGGHLASLRALLVYAKEGAAYRVVRGQTPLMAAARSCIPDVVQVVLAAGSVVNAKDEDGNTALMSVADHFDGFGMRRHADADCVRAVGILLTAGADPWLTNREGMNALEIVRTRSDARWRAKASDQIEVWMKQHPKNRK